MTTCECRFSAQHFAPTSHTAKSAAVTSAPYFTGRPRCSISNFFVENILRNFRTADLRWRLVVSHTLSSTFDRSTFDPLQYSCLYRSNTSRIAFMVMKATVTYL